MPFPKIECVRTNLRRRQSRPPLFVDRSSGKLFASINIVNDVIVTVWRNTERKCRRITPVGQQLEGLPTVAIYDS